MGRQANGGASDQGQAFFGHVSDEAKVLFSLPGGGKSLWHDQCLRDIVRIFYAVGVDFDLVTDVQLVQVAKDRTKNVTMSVEDGVSRVTGIGGRLVEGSGIGHVSPNNPGANYISDRFDAYRDDWNVE